ncbi:DUF4388 domain-containing protein, partial [Myxococcota bacterium]
MALKGTLKDFGIADIFQLISHQSKTGVLHLHSKNKEVRISFVNGDVVQAESTTRKKRDLLGAMLVRADAISEAQLEQALEIQKRTLKRLGHILIERGFLQKEELKQFTHLQTTETVYKLFNWETGTYAFETEEVAYDKETVEPIRSENVLMEGFRMVDEWPMIRKKITSYEMSFKKVKDLPEEAAPKSVEEEIDGALDDMFADKGTKKGGKGLGRNETKVYKLIEEGRNVQKLIDLSRLGEFETCKALLNHIHQGYIKVDTTKKEVVKEAEKPGARIRRIPFGRILLQTGMYIFIIGLLFILYRMVDVDLFSLSEETGTRTFKSPAAKEMVGRCQERRLRAALDVYLLETGHYPDELADLVRQGLVDE